MRQRVMIAMALSCSPEILIADEPTTALDVTIQAQILREIEELRAETGVAVLLITHDLGVVAEVASRVVVMYAGRVVEQADVHELFKDPLHPYSWGLLGFGAASRPGPTGPDCRPSRAHRRRCSIRRRAVTSSSAVRTADRAARSSRNCVRAEPGSGHTDRCLLSLSEKRSLRLVDGAIGLPTTLTGSRT